MTLFRVGRLAEGLNRARTHLQGDDGYGFSDMLMLLDGLLKYQYPDFSSEHLDEIEEAMRDVTEHTFKIHERLAAIRASRL